MTPEFARRIADAIAANTRAILEQHNIRDGAGDIARAIGRTSAQAIAILIEKAGGIGGRLLCVACGSETGKTTNDMCETCYRREITREKDEDRAR